MDDVPRIMEHHIRNRGPKVEPLEKCRSFSQAVLGSLHRLEVAAGIARMPEPMFYARQLARDLTIPDGVVGNELKHFVDAGIVVKIGRVAGPIVYLERQQSAFWGLCLGLFDELQDSDNRLAEDAPQ